MDLWVKKAKNILKNLYNSRDIDLGEDTVVLKCANGIFKAHKSVLTSESDYFIAMFGSDNVESRTKTIKLEETSCEVMDIIIKYLYNQDLPEPSDIPEELLQDLILEADKLLLTDLFDKYWKFYSNLAMTPKNFIHLWQLSHTLNKRDLNEKLMTFLADNLPEITKSEAFLNISASQVSNLIPPDLELNDSQRTALFRLALSSASIANERNAKDVLSLLSKCNLQKLSDLVILNATKKDLRNDVKELINNEVVKRWQKSTEPNYFIHKICVKDDGKCSRNKFSLKVKKSLKGKACEKNANIKFIESLNVSIRFCGCKYSPTVIQLCIGETFSKELSENIVFETASSSRSIFKLSNDKGYLIIDAFDKYTTILNGCCSDARRLLLLITGKCFFDLDDYSIGIFNSFSCEIVTKPPGKWKCFNCPSRNLEVCDIMGICIYFFNENNQLLLFDVETGTWQEDPVPIDSEINLNEAKFVNYGEGFVIVAATKKDYPTTFWIYSLRKKCKIAGFSDTSNDVFFDFAVE